MCKGRMRRLILVIAVGSSPIAALRLPCAAPRVSSLCMQSSDEGAPEGRSKWVRERERIKAAQQAEYLAIAERAAKQEAEKKAKLEADAEVKRREREARDAAAASYQDNVDLYRPGGVMRDQTNFVTREDLKNAQKTSSPAIDATEALDKALKRTDLDAQATTDLLTQLVEQARAVGVRAESPTMKRALSLMATLSVAAAQEQEQETMRAQDPQQAQMDALFGEGFAIVDEGLDF
jgi:regulator of replication initiation timing